MKIYTKTGDKGSTSLVGGKRVKKNDLRLQAYGTVDELNSFLGLLRAKSQDDEDKRLILDVQNLLFSIGAHLATDKDMSEESKCPKIEESDIQNIEKTIDFISNSLPKLNNFIVYGEDELSAICHVCRAIARRAERDIISVCQEYTVDDNVMVFMNRLSDLLFVLARRYTKKSSQDDFLWQKRR
jgi:cob(I)alamin adenosyltransferase